MLWILVTAFFGYQARNLQPDFEFEKLFPTNDPDIEFYEKHRKHFGYDNDFLLLIVETDQLFDSPFLNRISSVSDNIRQLPGTETLISPTGLQQPIESPMGLISIPLIHIDEPEKWKSDSLRIFTHPFFSNFFGKEKRSILINITHEHFQSSETSEAYLTALQGILDKCAFRNYRLVGKLTAQSEFIELIQKDFSLFLGMGLIISLLLLLIIFRNLRSALLPYLISLTSLIWLLGTMALIGMEITILGSLIPPIILFVSTSDAIHFLNAYRHQKTSNPIESIQLAALKVFVPTLLTSVTTGIGFLSLLTINTEPVQSLGTFTALGVCFAFIITFLFGPLVIYGWKPPVGNSASLKWIAVKVLKNQKPVLFISIALIGIALWGVSLVRTNARLLDDLPSTSKVKADFEFAASKYGGFKPWEMAFWPKDSASSIWDQQVMAEAQKIQEYILSTYGVDHMWSPVSLVKMGNQMIHGGQNTSFEFPETENYDKAISALAPLIQRDSSVQNTASKNHKYARIIGFIPEWGSRKTMAKNENLRSFIERNVDTSMINYRITGTTYLIDKSNHQLSEDLLKGLFLAIVLVSIILALYFKSSKMLLVSLLPNLAPLLLIGGIIGFSGIDLSLTTAIIFAVSFGIAVDDTIHFISVYQKQKAGNRVFRLIKTFRLAGSAIIITSLIITAGFGLFLFSSFGATYYLGLFLCLSLVFALVIDLTLLPLLLHHSNKHSRS